MINGILILIGYTFGFFGLAVILWSMLEGFDNKYFRRFARIYFSALSIYVIFLLTAYQVML